MRSIRSSFPGRTRNRRERGYVLISAVAFAVLYFALMELMLIDSQRALRDANRFRAKVIATTLAENGAELAAEQLSTRYKTEAEYANEQGRMMGTMERTESSFLINAVGSSTGVPPVTATVKVVGDVNQHGRVAINYTYHSQ